MGDLTLGEMSLEMLKADARLPVALNHGLHKVAQYVEDRARAMVGIYNPAVGPFPAWAPLAESTEDGKAKGGYPANSPLLRTGELRDSFKHEVHGLEALVGSTDPVMLFHEFGTRKMPPRPVIGPAAFGSREFIERTITAAAVTGLASGGKLPPALAYEFSKNSA